jgi:transposase
MTPGREGWPDGRAKDYRLFVNAVIPGLVIITRNLVEGFVNRMKHYRRIATQHEKTACKYLMFVNLAAALVSPGATVNMT